MNQQTGSVPLNEVVTDSYEHFDDTGATYRVFECIDEYAYDRIVIRFDVRAASAGSGGNATRGARGADDDVPYQMRLYENADDEEPAERIAFVPRNHRFSPISVIGKGESDQLQGVSPTVDTYSDIPCIVHDVWKAIGFTVIPDGDASLGNVGNDARGASDEGDEWSV